MTLLKLNRLNEAWAWQYTYHVLARDILLRLILPSAEIFDYVSYYIFVIFAQTITIRGASYKRVRAKTRIGHTTSQAEDVLDFFLRRK